MYCLFQKHSDSSDTWLVEQILTLFDIMSNRILQLIEILVYAFDEACNERMYEKYLKCI